MLTTGTLRCAECGCFAVDPRGWIGQSAFDSAEEADPSTAMLCPPCAASRFGYRPEDAGSYVCMWDPPPGASPDHQG